ncbi:MAG: HAMP domain-containing histidine kinase [Clostridia bacterium]|nr:HAMP domain-containing histidine kinase [Clostridia bacterium]
MKKSLSCNFWVKLATWILLALFVFLFFLSVAGIAVLIRTGAYWDGGQTFRESVAEQVFSFDKVRIRYVMREYLDGGNVDDSEYRKMYARENSNVFFTISDSNGNIIADYGSEDDFQIEYKYEEFFMSADKEKELTEIFATEKEAFEFMETFGKEHYISDWIYSHSTGELDLRYYSLSDITYTVNAFIRKNFSSEDRFFYTLRGVDFIVNMKYWIILFAVFTAVMCFLSLVFLCASAGRNGEGELKLSFFNRIPIDIFWGFCALACFILILAFSELSLGDEYEWFTVAMFVMVSSLCAVMLSASIVTLAARIKAKKWYKNTVIYRILKLLKKLFSAIGQGAIFLMKNVSLFWQALGALIVLKAMELFCIMAGSEIYILFWIFEFLALIALVIYVTLSLRKLQKAAREMAGGNLDYRAELAGMPHALREHGENLNNIGEGLKTALGEKMKSEHMKAELITNVSHDIKTPLTSIVNYVDLLKKEGLESENAAEYLEVLDRQSAKLKKLTEDLIEASKATSGCIAVNAEELDINVLLSQACGEYEGKLSENKLTPVLTLAESNPVVFADGGLVWRVFDNLLNNICKYSQKGTRVYLKTETKAGKAHITFSNISAAQLDISSEELMERFVRGDSSRNTEGSGLGLSIARSLTELQSGFFDIKIDGDLFKVEITFDIIKNN